MNENQAISIRLTHPDNVYDPAWDQHYLDKIIQVISCLGVVQYLTYGHEISIKQKKHHFHAHLRYTVSTKYIKGISNYVKRHLKDEHDMDLPPSYSISHVTLHEPKKDSLTLPEEEACRWHGYVFKDYKTFEEIPKHLQQGFSDNELRDMWIRATTERKKSIATFKKHENKLNADKQSRKLLWEWLDKELPHLQPPSEHFAPQKDDIFHLVGTKIVEYNITYNDFRIPMDLKRRVIQYLAYKGMSAGHIAMVLMK